MVLRNNIVLTVAGLASPKTSATIDAVAGRKSLGHMTLLGLGVFIQRVRPKPNVELFIKKSKLSKLSLWKVRRLAQLGTSHLFIAWEGGGSLNVLVEFRGESTQICLEKASLRTYKISQSILLRHNYLLYCYLLSFECVHFFLYRESFLRPSSINPSITCLYQIEHNR